MNDFMPFPIVKRCIALVIVWPMLVGSAGADAIDAGSTPPKLVVETNFPSGSGKVVAVDQTNRYIKIEPMTHASKGWACWWYIRVTGIQSGETITLEVGPEPWATPQQAAFSIDHETWTQTSPGEVSGKSIVYRQKVDAPVVWFAWGPPFTVSDAQQLVDQAAEGNMNASVFTLCETRDGRPVPALRVVPPNNAATSAVWIQARQHAWESGSSWVCKGFVDWLVSDDPRAISLLDTTIVSVVPIMDVDSVAIGAGGKDQDPHDHNRDWSGKPHWRSVAAAMEELKRLDGERRLKLFMDLHNPGASTLRPFYYLTPRNLMTEARQRNLDRFLAASRIEINGPLPFVGETRESGPSYDKGWKEISKNWVTLNTSEQVVAATLETAWNTPNSTIEGYETVGKQLGLAIQRYLHVKSTGTIQQELKPGQRNR